VKKEAFLGEETYDGYELRLKDGYARLYRCARCAWKGSLRKGFYRDKAEIHLDFGCLSWNGCPTCGANGSVTPPRRSAAAVTPSRTPAAPVATPRPATAPDGRNATATSTNGNGREGTASPSVRTGDRDCERCGVAFVPSRSDARFCSASCRVAAHKAKAKAAANGTG
jgi:hypothetical protein